VNAPGRSRSVVSAQTAASPALPALVRRHLQHPYRRTPAPYNLAAVDTVLAHWGGQALLLDSGCGTGESSARLARESPESFVVGLDQSEERLSRGSRKLGADGPPNLLLLRADAAEVWALLAEHGVRVTRHLLLYPNPWPKAAHLGRRWHGHPRWPALLALGGRLELRSNWEIYAREFAMALEVSGHHAQLGRWHPATPLTPFERKYMDSGHALWWVVADLDAPAHQAASPAGLQAGNTPVDR